VQSKEVMLHGVVYLMSNERGTRRGGKACQSKSADARLRYTGVDVTEQP